MCPTHPYFCMNRKSTIKSILFYVKNCVFCLHIDTRNPLYCVLRRDQATRYVCGSVSDALCVLLFVGLYHILMKTICFLSKWIRRPTYNFVPVKIVILSYFVNESLSVCCDIVCLIDMRYVYYIYEKKNQIVSISEKE